MATKMIAAFVALTVSATTYGADFKVSYSCRESIKAGLERRNLILTKINSASYFPGGSDGASSWDSEYSVDSYVRDENGNSTRVLISIDDSYNCRVMAVNKAN